MDVPTCKLNSARVGSWAVVCSNCCACLFGSIASILSNKSTNEADFWLISYNIDQFCCESLTDFSLEGILHAKQLDSFLGI